jgi:hypothetical protein
MIRAAKSTGSARLLNGLTGTVIAPHPIARGWVIVHLDLNQATTYRTWPVPERLLVPDTIAGDAK